MPDTPRIAAAILAGLLGAAYLGGCASRPALSIAQPAAEFTSEAEDPAFAAGSSILKGFEIAATPEDWQIGDRILLGIRAKKAGSETVRFLLIELMSIHDTDNVIAMTSQPAGRAPYKFISPAAMTSLRLYDEHGGEIKSTTGRFPEKLLGYGLYDGIAPLIDHPEMRDKPDQSSGLSDEQFEHAMRGWLTMFSFSGSLGKEGMFRDMLYGIVSRPYWLQYLFDQSIGLNFGDGWPATAAAWTPVAGRSVGTVRLSLVCTIAKHKGAVADVLACPPLAPLCLSGGVLHVDVRNADDPAISMEVRLLAAKRGTKGRTFKEFSDVIGDAINAKMIEGPLAPGSHQSP
jgi:hypothetical protein